MAVVTYGHVLRRVMGALLYFPSRKIVHTPEEEALDFSDVEIETDDGEILHGWWVRAPGSSPVGHVLLFHGNAGNMGDRVAHAALLARAGFDVMLFDYRGYGLSTGSPDELGTYRDGHAARRAMVALQSCDPDRIIFLGESLGGAVAAEVALSSPPRALILQSAFASLRAVARKHYPYIPGRLVPDAYPTSRRIGLVRAPVLVLHGDRDEIVPEAQGRALFEAASEPKHSYVFADAGHNDLISAGEQYTRVVMEWWTQVSRSAPV